MTSIHFTTRAFQPHPLLRQAHLQTLIGEQFRKVKAQPPFRRERLTTPDKDFIDLDFAEVPGYTWHDLGVDAPILYFLHGLEGNARRGYATDLYHAAARQGWRCVGINYRSCSGEMNHQARFYHMGATEDIDFVLQHLLATYPDAPLAFMGVSLGANITLKYFGEQGTALNARIIGGAVISPPFVATGYQPISDAIIGKLYGHHFLHSLQAKVRRKAHKLYHTAADPYAALQARTLRDFDDAITAPLHGFDDAHDYYARCNAINFLAEIQRPTLLIRAKDDPFFNPHDIPYDLFAENPYLYPLITRHGGHVGFIEGISPYHYRNWAQEQALAFVNAIL